jgi:hypothetical protein
MSKEYQASTGTEKLSPWEIKHREIKQSAAEIMSNPAQFIEQINVNKNQEGIVELMRKINPEYSLDSESYESLLNNLITVDKEKIDPRASELIEAIAEGWALDERSKMAVWVHSVCHLFEKYGEVDEDNGEPDPSLLNDKLWNKGTEVLVKSLISRAADIKKYPLSDKYNRNNLPRVLGPLMKYNLDAVEIANLDKFPLKPEHPDYDTVANQLSDDDELNEEIREFLSASSPREFILGLINNGKPLPTSNLEKTMSLLEAMKDDITPDQLKIYLKEAYPVNDQETDIDTMKRNIAIAKEAKEKLEGLFVDVDGTLIMPGNRINTKILETMKRAAERGTLITVFTGGSPEIASQNLKSLGVPEQFLNVKSKADFRGKELQWLIDDTRPELQGFTTSDWHLPSWASYRMKE